MGRLALGLVRSNITYYFAHNSEFRGFDTNWTSTEQNGYRSALQSWANVANLTFTEVFSPGQRDLHRTLGAERLLRRRHARSA